MNPIQALRATLLEQIRELAAAGRSDPEIATALDLTVEGVRTMRRRAQIPPGVPPGGGPVRSDWRERVTDAWEAGLTDAQISEATGYALRTVGAHRGRLGLAANRVGPPPCTGPAHVWGADSRCETCGLQRVRRQVGRRAVMTFNP